MIIKRNKSSISSRAVWKCGKVAKPLEKPDDFAVQNLVDGLWIKKAIVV